MITLGERYRDKFTGCTGTATGRAEYLDGSPSVQLTALGREGKPQSVWINEAWLEPVSVQSTGHYS